jgi:hypothetical protein
MSGRPAGRQTELGLPTNAQQCLRFEPQMEMSPAERERLRTIAKATTAAAQVEVCPPPRPIAGLRNLTRRPRNRSSLSDLAV